LKNLFLRGIRKRLSLPAPLNTGSIEGTLQQLWNSSPILPLSKKDRIVIFSDLHMGDGGSRDDFRHNGELVEKVLRDHYLAAGYSLVLNGDIEELQRFRLPAILRQWADMYSLFDEFRAQTRLFKIVGNHDESLYSYADPDVWGTLLDGVRLEYGKDTLFLFHGHQATIFFERFNDVSGFFLRYGANTLRIHNVPVKYASQKKYRTEHRVYAFSTSRKIVSIIGHTHRPLFESLSKIDTLRFRIEQLCHDYVTASPRARTAIETVITDFREELTRLWERERKEGLRSGLYNEEISIPCLFNSGCAIGKRGVTAIEISGGQIALVHWFDKSRGSRHMIEEGRPAERLGSTDYFRSVLKQDRLEYIFSRIKLLA
jgi:UDP-2,3-diacylglucosamine pyrophosphatase LpxH